MRKITRAKCNKIYIYDPKFVMFIITGLIGLITKYLVNKKISIVSLYFLIRGICGIYKYTEVENFKAF